MRTFLPDIRYAVRILLKTPGFTLVAVLTLAIGIGAATAVFTQLNAILFKTLPVERPEELRQLAWTSPRPAFVANTNSVSAGPRLSVGDTYGTFSYSAYTYMRDGNGSFSDLACWVDVGDRRPVVMGELGFGSVQFVSGNYFRTLGVRVALGRTITSEDDQFGAGSKVAVLSDAFWQRVFGRDPNVLGTTINLNGNPFVVIGVLPERFFGMDPAIMPDVMVPITTVQVISVTVNPLAIKSNWVACRVVGRIKPGIADEQARVDVEHQVHEAIRSYSVPQEYDMPRLWILDAKRGTDTLRQETSTPLVILMAAVGGILLISCANVAGLMLVRGRGRQKEIATRLALGAPRSRLVRQLLTESIVLSLVGASMGIAFSYALALLTPSLLTQLMPSIYGANRTLGVTVVPDLRVLTFSVMLGLLTGTGFGIAPAYRSTRLDLLSVLKQAAAPRSRNRFLGGKAMVVVQTALAVAVLVAAGLFVRTVVNLRAADLGFKMDGLLYMKIEPNTGHVPPQGRQDFFEKAVKQLESTPGVLSATAVVQPPLGSSTGVGVGQNVLTACTPDANPKDPGTPSVSFNIVAPHFFTTVQLPLLLGRDLEWTDRPVPGITPPVVVNEAFAGKYYPGKNPIGLPMGFNCPANPAQTLIVGVVGDSKLLPRREAGPGVYFPLGGPGDPVTLIVRTAGDPKRMLPTLRRSMAEMNAAVPIFGEITPAELREQQIKRERLLAAILTCFAGVALLLSSVGIYGVLAHTVSQRTSEIGIRLAIGAHRLDVMRIIVGQSVVSVLLGLVIGIVTALVTTRVASSILFGVTSADPLTVVIAAVLLLLAAAIAAFIPANRACRIDPLKALRYD